MPIKIISLTHCIFGKVSKNLYKSKRAKTQYPFKNLPACTNLKDWKLRYNSDCELTNRSVNYLRVPLRPFVKKGDPPNQLAPPPS